MPNTNKNLEALLAEHAALYRAFLPTLNDYQEKARKALDLQVAIFKLKLTEAFPGAPTEEAAHVCTISARETPAKCGDIINALLAKDVTVTRVVFDPITFSYLIFAKP